MNRSSVLFLLPLLVAVASAQPRLDTLRHIHPRPGTGLSALWGYTAPNGREYALVGITVSGSGSTSGGTSIVDITIDQSPRVVAHINGPNSTWREMKTYRQYAYVVTEASTATGVQIIDLSQLPDTATLVSTFNYTSGTKHTRQSHTITITDGFMYLNGCAGWSPGGILIFDLRNNPLSPQFVGEYQPAYAHDSYVFRDTIYMSAIYSGGGVFIADARNKASVTTVAQITYTSSGTHNAWLTKDRRYVLTTDEITHPQKNVKIWDIGNLPSVPTTPTATFTVDPASTVHNVHVRGDYAYCAWYQGYGLQVYNISNPAQPLLAAGYRTSTNSLAWETYPYFPSGKIILGDGSTGLWIFRFTELAARRAITLLQPVNNDTIRVRAPITFRWTKAADVNKDPHWYQVSLKGGTLDTTWRANDSVSVFGNFSRLQNGQTYRWRVAAVDEWNYTPSPDSSRFVFDAPTDAGEDEEVPGRFVLEQNYPNPFNPSTLISFEIPRSAVVALRVFNTLGEQVAELMNGTLPAGRHHARLQAADFPSGVYFYRLSTGERTETRKMLLMK